VEMALFVGLTTGGLENGIPDRCDPDVGGGCLKGNYWLVLVALLT
jgi:hypothetical protein